jgi:hypothetical protein
MSKKKKDERLYILNVVLESIERWDEEIPLVVVDVGEKTYKDAFGNYYEEAKLGEKGGRWVFEKIDNILASRYVKKAEQEG